MAALTRGSLPPSVYWRRRLVVLTVAAVIVWGVAHLLGGGGDPTPKANAAADLSAAVASPSAGSEASPSATPEPGTGIGAGPMVTVPSTSTSSESAIVPEISPTPEPLPTPTGACPPSDVSVSPSVADAVAGSDVTILLSLQTFNTPACTWHVGHRTMQVKITTHGGGDVWSTIQCKKALPTSTVTLYQEQPTPVTLTWSSREADASCSTHTDWADPGSYRVTGVALGGQPDEASFTLALEAPEPVVTPESAPSSTTKGSTAKGQEKAQKKTQKSPKKSARTD